MKKQSNLRPSSGRQSTNEGSWEWQAPFQVPTSVDATLRYIAYRYSRQEGMVGEERGAADNNNNTV